MAETDNKPFRILSLDGGGVRGVFQAAFLVKLAERLSEKKLGAIADNFDLIAGTSTGSIVGMALALGIDTQRILDLYMEQAGKIFGIWKIRKLISYLGNEPRYDQAKLKELLVKLFGNKQLGQSKTGVLITATSLDRFRYRTFTNLSKLGSVDNNLSAVDVVLASAAAPTYFKSHSPLGENISYVDGGLWANSPSLIAVLAANRQLDIPFERIRLLSVATGDFPNGIASAVYNELMPVGPTTIGTIFEIMFSCQSKFADEYAAKLVGKHNAIRISTDLQEIMPLDNATEALSTLPPLANLEAQQSLEEVLQLLTRGLTKSGTGETADVNEQARRQSGIPEIMGTKWAADWVYDDGKPFVNDKITFSRWTRDNQFEGYGEVTWDGKEYKYSITGEVSRNGIVVLTYKAENYPKEANIGMACLELSSSATELSGYWGGRASLDHNGRKVYTVRGGTVAMNKIKDLNS